MKTAGEIADNVLKEYEHFLNMMKNVSFKLIMQLLFLTLNQNQQVRVFPWFIGPIPRILNYPEVPHIHSQLLIRSTLSEVTYLISSSS